MAQVLEGSRLKSLRESRRLTQHDLASKMRQRGFGTTQTTVSRWESGQAPHSSVLPTLADVLGVEVAELFGSDEDEESAALLTVDPRDFGAAMQQLFNSAMDARLAELERA